MIKKFGMAMFGAILSLGMAIGFSAIHSETTVYAAAASTTAGEVSDSDGDGVTDNGYQYIAPGGVDATITGYYGTETTLTIPLSIKLSSGTLKVREIGDGAIAGKAGITGITIPDPQTSSTGASGSTTTSDLGIKTIGAGTFASCPMLTTVSISKTVTSIGDRAFGDCPSLTTITVGAGNQNYITFDGVLYQYVSSSTAIGTYKLLQYPVGKLDKTFTAPVAIANRLTLIGPSSFAGSLALESITLPDKIDGIMAAAFQGCENLSTINIPDKVTCIPDYCFEGCRSLKNPIISETVTNICPYAFANCSSLELNFLPSDLVTIGDMAFYNCDSLTELTIPGKVTSIGASCFKDCNRLSKLTAPTKLAQIGSGAFAGDSMTIYCHMGSPIYNYATSNGFGTVATFTVNFYSDTNVLLKSEEVVYGSSATAPVMGDRPGYKMTWSASFSPVTSDLNIKASYSRAYTVTFIDKFNNRTETVQVENQGAATAPKWKLTGYSLSWSEPFSYITNDKVIYAQWTDPRTGFVITEDVSIPLAVKTTFETAKAKYRVLSSNIQKPTVIYVSGISDANADEVSIPANVTYQGVKYQVTQIAEEAFKGNQTLKKLKIGANIKQIKPCAFEGCSSLEKIVIYSKKITKIGYDAFADIQDKATFRVYESKKKTYTNYIKKSGMTKKYRVLSL